MNNFLSLLLFVAGAHGATIPKGSINNNLSLTPKFWDIQFSVRVPSTPYKSGTGWYFPFPVASPTCADSSSCSHVDYVTTLYNDSATISAASAISMTFTVQVTSGSPVFDYHTAPGNTCVNPVHVRFLLETWQDNYCSYCPWPPTNDCDGCCQYNRWWSNPMAVEISAATGTVTLTVSLTDLSQWSSVAGLQANATACSAQGFAGALARIGRLGMTFGGGCFAGHGCFIDQGTGSANFILSNFNLIL